MPEQCFDDQPTCSFCGKKQSEVKKLIVGFNGTICDECVKRCAQIVEKKRQ